MNFVNRFTVQAPIETVWETLLDVERVAPCLPGAKVLERSGDDTYVVAMRVKVGPITMEYKGDIHFLAKDATAHRAVVGGSGRELRGQGTVEAESEMVLTQDGDDTIATIKTDVKLSGRAASMGQGVIAEVSKKLVDTFSKNLASMLAPSVDAPAAAATPPQPALASATPVAVAAPAPQFMPSDDAALPLFSVVGSVMAGRLRSPRVAVPVVVGIAVVVALVVLLMRR